MSPKGLPSATYRVQFNRQFAFRQAREIVSYLSELGISDLYASPVFLAGTESTHGYDVCAFDQFQPNLGKREDFDRLATTLHERGMGLLLDMVPNHMGASSGNAWWQDVLRHGAQSNYASFFDIDWNARPDHKILLPVLGDRYAEVLKRGELHLDFHEGEISLAYFQMKFPLSPESQAELRKLLPSNEGDAGAMHALKNLAREISTHPRKLHRIIEAQHYRLAFWRVGPHEINYRRFFDVTGLVSLRVEDERVFEATHRFVFGLLEGGQVTGLRIDHPDGLRDPKTYFDRLQQEFPVYVVAEKILSGAERLPADWQVSGTTGYDYLIQQNGIFVAEENEADFTRIYNRFSGESAEYAQVEYESKKYVLYNLFPKEVHSLTNRLRHIADSMIEGVDFTTPELEGAIIEYIAAFPVYRTYARAGLEELAPAEEGSVRKAAAKASARAPQFAAALRFLEPLLFLRIGPEASGALREEIAEFVYRFQQLTGPATAKGLEDTAFYRYVRLVTLNEVGGTPGVFGTNLEAFHEYNRYKQQCWPHSLLATSTHDTKRGEDFRARLNVLSELPAEWEKQIMEWAAGNGKFKSKEQSPNANDEYLLYQTLAGSWVNGKELDAYLERIRQYMLKATREAKCHTSWTDPNQAYEEATREFIERILHCHEFRQSLDHFAQRIAFFGIFNSLAQVLLKICSPGVPDFYQGTELWDFSLVDPDNRRPVDYDVRKAVLQRVKSTDVTALLRSASTGEVKMSVTRTALQLRAANRELFERGAYLPLVARGTKRKHVISFARQLGSKTIVAVAPRLPCILTGGAERAPVGSAIWGDTKIELAGTRYRDAFTGREIEGTENVGELLRDFPIALLEMI